MCYIRTSNEISVTVKIGQKHGIISAKCTKCFGANWTKWNDRMMGSFFSYENEIVPQSIYK